MSWQEFRSLLAGITGNLVALMSGVLAIAFTVVGLVWREAPAGEVFLGCALLGALLSPVLVWRDQYRESQRLRSRIAELTEIDYAYALVLESVQASLDLGNAGNTLELRLLFRNASRAPLQFTVEKLEQRIAKSAVQFTGGRFAILASGDRTVWFPGGGFSNEAYQAFPDRASGVVLYSVLYGAPGRAYARRATKTLLIDLFKKIDQHGNAFLVVNWRVDTQSDEPAGP